MDALLVSVGTDGDILPYVGLGAALRARGHRATLVASESYAPLAAAHGLAFRALVSAGEHRELFDHPDFWNPWKTAPLAARWGVRFLDRQYQLLASLVRSDSVLVASPGVFAAALVHEKLGPPLVNLVLQPWLLPSSIAPPRMPGMDFLERAPRPVWRLFWRQLDFVTWLLAGRELNRLRAKLGLKPLRRILTNWLSSQRVLGLFPEWYGLPPSDWPAQLRLTGFPRFDGGLDRELSPQLQEFCRAGDPPIAFTFGTGMAHPAALLRTATDTCARLGARGILLTRHEAQVPASRPPNVMHCSFAPFQKLFPLCAAVVNHGGIGTVATALAAGTPQLIRPLCFDQFDNAVRTQRLGAGDWLRSGTADGRSWGEALTRVMTAETRARCRAIAARFDRDQAFETAIRWIEEAASTPV